MDNKGLSGITILNFSRQYYKETPQKTIDIPGLADEIDKVVREVAPSFINTSNYRNLISQFVSQSKLCPKCEELIDKCNDLLELRVESERKLEEQIYQKNGRIKELDSDRMEILDKFGKSVKKNQKLQSQLEKISKYVKRHGWLDSDSFNESPVDCIIRIVSNIIADSRYSKEEIEHLKSQLEEAKAENKRLTNQ